MGTDIQSTSLACNPRAMQRLAGITLFAVSAMAMLLSAGAFVSTPALRFQHHAAAPSSKLRFRTMPRMAAATISSSPASALSPTPSMKNSFKSVLVACIVGFAMVLGAPSDAEAKGGKSGGRVGGSSFRKPTTPPATTPSSVAAPAVAGTATAAGGTTVVHHHHHGGGFFGGFSPFGYGFGSPFGYGFGFRPMIILPS